MKNSIKYLSCGIFALLMVSCADSFLQRDPYSSTLSEEQFQKNPNKLVYLMRGVYSMLYDVTEHDEFGKRSIDMYGDLLCGDMALTNHNYGWFYQDEQMLGRTNRTSYIWSYYYRMMRNINKVLHMAKYESGEDGPIKRIATYGLPTTYSTKNGVTTYYRVVGGDTIASYTEQEAKIAHIYAQALTMRGYIYSNLLMLYCVESNGIPDFDNTKCFPLYTEDNMEMEQPLTKVSTAYKQVETDLENAIKYFKAFETIKRDETKKLEVNAPVACGILAYSYLNKGKSKGSPDGDAFKEAYSNAKKYADEAIALSPCTILAQDKIYTDGFNDVTSTSWMWGQNVTIETTGGLASWFGQCDIHSYSYAWSGDTKAIDENLYKLIPDFDARLKWFNDGSANSTYKYCPDGKFFSAKAALSTKADDIDREWLSDNVFMRIESMYLIAAEASYRLKNDADAIDYLTAITDNRVMKGKETEYAAYKASLNHDNLLNEIEYNWRIEMWGEGYGLQTLRRLASSDGKNQRKRGGNHCALAGQAIDPQSSEFTLEIPSAETSYNTNL